MDLCLVCFFVLFVGVGCVVLCLVLFSDRSAVRVCVAGLADDRDADGGSVFVPDDGCAQRLAHDRGPNRATFCLAHDGCSLRLAVFVADDSRAKRSARACGPDCKLFCLRRWGSLAWAVLCTLLLRAVSRYECE